jgi:hypothetical protein
MRVGKTYFCNLYDWGQGAIVFSVINKHDGIFNYIPIIWIGNKESDVSASCGDLSEMAKKSIEYSPECHHDLIISVLSSDKSIGVDWDLYNKLCK